MKRLIAILLAMLMLMPMTAMADVSEKPYLMLKINTEYQEYDKDFILVTVEKGNYQLLAPARPFAEGLKAEVEWDDATQTVTISKDDKSAAFTIGAENGLANGIETKLETPAQLVDGTAFVPVEFVGNAFGMRVLREQYGRHIRMMTKLGDSSPKYDGPLKPGMAELISTVHRPVPTEFEKSSDMDDLIFMTDIEYVPEEELLGSVELDPSRVPEGEVIFTDEDLFDGIPDGSQTYGSWKKVDIDDPELPFDKALEITCSEVPSDDGSYIVKCSNRVEEFIDPLDKYVVKLWVRKTEGGHQDTGAGMMRLQIEESYIPKWDKGCWEEIEVTDDWKQYIFLNTGVENSNHIGFRAAFYRQTLQIGGWEIQKLDRDADVSHLIEIANPLDLITPEISKDAPWRAEALDRIERVRKGDFKVVVKDAAGNPVPNAEVELDMFEHEFHFGGAIDTSFYAPYAGNVVHKYVEQQAIAQNFNMLGCDNEQKLGVFETNPALTKRIFADAKAMGIKYFRGHAIWMPDINEGDARPFRFYGKGQIGDMDWETFETYVKNHAQRLVEAMPEITEWDVSNEMVNRTFFNSRFGYDHLFKIYEWCDEVLPEYMNMGICDNQTPNYKYWDMIDEFDKRNVPYDMLIYQQHTADFANDNNNCSRRIGKFLEYYDRFTYEHGKQFAISEYSCYSDDYNFQADFTRDALIAAFSHAGCDSFTTFYISDAYNGATTAAGASPLYDKNINPKPALKQWQDLIYNKWWTRDAITTTDADGRGQVRGFYGDYDITVRVNGEVVKTEMAAFHKGYENELTIVLQ